MKSSSIRNTAAALLLSAALLAAQAKPEDKAAKPPKGSIEGVVVDSSSATPVKSVTLLLVRENDTGARGSTTSDDQGKFTLKDLDAGSYAIIAQHPKYALQSYGSRNGILGGTMLTIAAGQNLKDITFRLLPNGIISGKVLDSDREPVNQVMVAALRGMYQRGRREYIPVGTAMTNDLGEYRISNLAPGRYLVSAIPMPMGPVQKPAEGETETAFMPTYFPNTPDPAGATWIQVAAGAETGSMDIRLGRSPSVHIKGRVMGDIKDQNITVKLIPKNGGLLASILGRTTVPNKVDSRFELAGATKGTYTLRVTDQTGIKVMGTSTEIEVTDKPIDGVVINLMTNAEISGAVSLVGADMKPAAGVPLKGARVILESTTGMSIVPPTTNVGDDGTFTLKDITPDKYIVRLMNGPEGSYVEAVQLGPITQGEDGLDLAAGRGKVEIRLRLAGAEIAGVVNGADDKPMPGASVVLIPNDGRYTLYQATLTDQNGAFRIKAITPGEYKVFAWEVVEPGAYFDPEFVKPFGASAEKVSLKDNEHKAVTVKAIPKAD